ncbi:hypothetical protein F383_24525 [Gossypium arboreum]|uniref:Uncharacterized protein n=1 Tax=Gossypium arboreum TaxID=29729 RepID=A0A0B0MN11_GOSAR|nr:hypothetical protein F383_24525 [Gossypium arboreum]
MLCFYGIPIFVKLE